MDGGGQASTTSRTKAEKVDNYDIHNISANNKSALSQLAQESNDAFTKGDYNQAVQLYTEAIALSPHNHILFTNRSASYAQLHKYAESLDDARKAKHINPQWTLAYLQEGMALLQLGNHGDAMASFASGLAQESSNSDLLSSLIDTALQSPLKEKLNPVFQQLQKMNLDHNAFVIIAVIGQELLAAGHYSASVTMLESALSIGTISLKLRGSVFSALSRAYWGTGDIDKAIIYMDEDLNIMKSMGDQGGECRAYGNLGSAYFSQGYYREALSNHRHQLVLAMKLKDRPTAASALSNLGHVYTAIGDYPNALNSHKQCVLLCRQRSDKYGEAREIGNAGAVYLAMGSFDLAINCHNEHLRIAKLLKNAHEEARAYSNLGSAYHYRRDYEKAIAFHNQVLKIAEQKNDKVLEARAYAGLGHAARCKADYSLAKNYHEKQLDNALQTRDRVAEGRACANLGIIYHQLNEYEAALKLHMMHLKLAKKLGDRASEGRAYGNIGNAYSALGQHEIAMRFHKQELSIATEVNDRHSEMSTHGNLAVAYHSLGISDKALHHFLAHLNTARELKDSVSEARALCNLGNFYSVKENYSEAIPYYEQFLTISQELHEKESEAKACCNLGYAYSLLGNYSEALDYYEQHLNVAKEMQDKMETARAYCSLGLAHKALSNYDNALDCQRKALALMKTLKNVKGTFKVLGNIGDVLLKTGQVGEAVQTYQQQLTLAKQCKNQNLIATAYGALGMSHCRLGQYDKALGFHNQELTIRQEMDDLRGECRAHGSIGNVHMCLCNYSNAYKCYEEQLKHSQELHDSRLEAQACGNLGIVKMNTAHFDEAIGLFEQQLAMLEQLYGNKILVEKGKAFGNLGDCYEALSDFEESVKCHEQYLAVSQTINSLLDQDKAYRGLGNAHRAMGNLQQALVCFEKRLVVAHEMDNNQAKASAYGELGCLHSLLGNFEQAISCLEHQLDIARDVGDKLCEGEAACGLGNVYQQMGEYETALEYHQIDLQIAESLNNSEAQCRAYGNFGLSHESLGNHEEAVRYQEQHLSMAAQLQDKVAKTMAFSSLGRVHHALGNYTQAVQYLQQGLQIAEQLGRREDEAKIRYRLGLSLWGRGQLDECQQQLYQAADLFETIRRESQNSSDYKLSLFDLQTACYQALQRVLVTVDSHEEALVVAERACTRAFIDLLLERQSGVLPGLLGERRHDLQPITLDQVLGIVSQQKNIVLSYSIAAGFLYTWLITPKDGIVKFHQCNMAEFESNSSDAIDTQSLAGSTVSLLDQYVGDVRESMGVEGHDPSNGQTKLSRSCSRSTLHGSVGGGSGAGSSSVGSLDTLDTDDSWQQQLEEIGDKLNAENDRTGFLRMVNRNHIFNCSNYSLSSLFSLSAGLNGINPSITNMRNAMKSKQRDKSPIAALYELLVAPMEESLQAVMDGTENRNLVLVLQGDLYLVPFAMLRPTESNHYLFERYNLIIMPSITALQPDNHHSRTGRPTIDSSGAVVIGNPKLTSAIQQQWQLKDIPGSEYEARIVAELLTAKPLIGQEATKTAILQQLEHVEVIHISAHISWKLSAIILSPGELGTSSSSTSQFNHAYDLDDSSSDVGSLDTPSLSEYLLTAADILNLKLRAKLVVLNSGHTHDRAGRINSDGVVGLTRALLSVGAGCVLYSLWQVPDQASKLLMKTMYVALQESHTVTQALHLAIKAVQAVKQFSHPSNWGGWVLVGKDIMLSSKMALMGHAICELLQSPSQCRDSMRVLLHLIEKSLQRIHQGAKNPMYTMFQSIENKVGQISGWKDLLHSVGFRFEPAANGMPVAVFFPQTDPGDRLTRASASLQALLGLPSNSITALSKFLNNYEAGEAIITTMHDILSCVSSKENIIEVSINVKLWQIPGCHEFLASLGFDLLDVGRDDVTLRLGKQATKRHLQFALQSLVAVFDTQEAPKSLALDSSSSLESLSSSHSSNTTTTSASTLSNLAGTPPLSPRAKKKSLFNPAEMEKMRNLNRQHLMQQGGLVGKSSTHYKSSKIPPPNPSLCLSHQNRIKAMYPPENCFLRSPATSPESCMSVSSTSSPEELSNLLHLTNSQSTPNIASQDSQMGQKTGGSTDSFQKAPSYMKRLIKSYSMDDSCSDKESPGADSTHHFIQKQIWRDKRELGDAHSSSNEETFSDKPFDRLSPSCTSGSSRISLLASKFNKSDSGIFSTVSQSPKNPRPVFSSSNSLFKRVGGNGEQQKVPSSASVLNPEEIAQKILADVAPQREAVEQLQKASFVQSQKKTHILRSEQIQQRMKSSPDGHSHSSYSSSSANSSRRASPACSHTGDMITCRHTPSPSDKSCGTYANNSSCRSPIVYREHSPNSLYRSSSPNVGKSPAIYPNNAVKKESHLGGGLWVNTTENQSDLPMSSATNQFSSCSSIGKSTNSLAGSQNKIPLTDGHSDLTNNNHIPVSPAPSVWSKGTQQILTSLSSSQLSTFSSQNNQSETFSSSSYNALTKPPIPAKPQLRQTSNSAFKCLSSGESNSKGRTSSGQQGNQSVNSNKQSVNKKQLEKASYPPTSFDTVVLVHSKNLPVSKSHLGTFSTFSTDHSSTTPESPEYSVLEPEVPSRTIPSHADKQTLNSQLHTFTNTDKDFQLKNSPHSEFKDSVSRKTIPDYTTVLPAVTSSECENPDSNANQFPYPRSRTTHSQNKRYSDPSILETDLSNPQVNNQTNYLPSPASVRSSEGRSVQKRVCFKDLDKSPSNKPSSTTPIARNRVSFDYEPMDNLRYSDFPLATSRPEGSQSHFSSSVPYSGEQSSSVNIESVQKFSRHSYSQLTNGRPPPHVPAHLPSSFSHSANHAPTAPSSAMSARPIPPPRSTSIVHSAKTNNGVSPSNHRKSKVLQISKC